MIYSHSQQQQQIISAIAQLLNEFHMDFHTFCNALREQYVCTAYREFGGIARTALKSGIDRRTVSSILKGEQQRHKRPLLVEIVDAITEKAHDKDMMLPKNGINSMASIIEDVAYGTTTTKTVLDVLTETGIIEDHDSKFKFVGYPPPSIDQQVIDAFTQQFCQMITDLTDHMKKIKAQDNGLTKDN